MKSGTVAGIPITTSHPPCGATGPGSDGRAGIDAALVRRLVAAQFPQWSQLAVTPVPNDGWDNRTYRLGETMTVRLPTAAAYAAAIDKDDRRLPGIDASAGPPDCWTPACDLVIAWTMFAGQSPSADAPLGCRRTRQNVCVCA